MESAPSYFQSAQLEILDFSLTKKEGERERKGKKKGKKKGRKALNIKTKYNPNPSSLPNFSP